VAVTVGIIPTYKEIQGDLVVVALLTAMLLVILQVPQLNQVKAIQVQALTQVFQAAQVQQDHGVVVVVEVLVVLAKTVTLVVVHMAVTVVLVYLLVLLDTLYIMVAVVVDLAKPDHLHFQRVLVVLAAAA
jgi:hypothetical protein